MIHRVIFRTAGFLGVKMPPPEKIFNCRAQQEVDQKLSLCKANGISVWKYC